MLHSLIESRRDYRDDKHKVFQNTDPESREIRRSGSRPSQYPIIGFLDNRNKTNQSTGKTIVCYDITFTPKVGGRPVVLECRICGYEAQT